MKTIQLCMCLCAVFCVNSLFAQEELGDGLLFPQFESGIVTFKNGTRTQASLNYNMLYQKMWFKDNENNIMEIANLPQVLMVTIGERRFFPVPTGAFYEQLPAGGDFFFVQHLATMISQGKASAYGGYSQTSAATSIGSLESGTSGRVVLKADEKFKQKRDFVYYLKSGNSYKRFTSAKALGKLFKGQASKIEEFAKEQSINFSKTEDVAKIVEYGFSLMNK